MTIVGPNPVTMVISIFGIIITYIIYIECKKKWENTILFPFAIICMIFSGLLLMGFIGYPFPKGGGDQSLPVGEIDSINITSSSSVIIRFGTIMGSEILQTDFTYLLSEPSGERGYKTLVTLSLINSESNSIEMQSSSSNVTALFTNGNSTSDNLGPGDYIEISGLTPGKEYTFFIYHLPSLSIVYMEGQNTFTMPNQ